MAKRAGGWFWQEGRRCLTESLPYKFQHTYQFILVLRSLPAVKGWVLYQKPSSVPTPVLELSSALHNPKGKIQKKRWWFLLFLPPLIIPPFCLGSWGRQSQGVLFASVVEPPNTIMILSSDDIVSYSSNKRFFFTSVW